MKKIVGFFCAAVMVILTTGCHTDGDPVCTIHYRYVNKCSSEITVTAYSDTEYNTHGMEDYSPFVIQKNGQYVVSLTGEGGYPLPFYGMGGLITVSNGKKTVAQISRKGELYKMESYTFISENEKKWDKTVEFVFTDAFFENGEPIEQ